MMKRTIKKLMAALLAVALLCAMAVPAFAVDAPGSITISNAVAGETYNAYKMFAVLGQNGEGADATYTYKVDLSWKAFFSEGGAGHQYIQLDKLDQPIPTEGLSADQKQAFAKAAVAYATDPSNHITATGTAMAAGTTGQSTSVTVDNLPLGYYVVDTSLGSLCSLDTVGGANVAIKEKNDVPTIEKNVKTAGTDDYSSSNTAAVGDTVSYKVTIHAKEGAAGYVLTDTLSKGLTFDENSIKITDNKNTTFTKNTDYSIATTKNSDNTTFTITFLPKYLNTVDNSTVIDVTYNAVLNKDAIINNEATGNTNTAQLKYGNGSTVEEKTNTYSFKFDLVKTDKSNKLLEGAEFQLYAVHDSDEPLKFVATADGYRLAQEGEENATSKLSLSSKKAYTISGLNKRIYYLEETVAPGGYNRLTERVPVDLTQDSVRTPAKITNETLAENTGFKVENNAGATLPSTGGMGTTLFYVIGGGLMVAAVVLLVTKKRMENK